MVVINCHREMIDEELAQSRVAFVTWLRAVSRTRCSLIAVIVSTLVLSGCKTGSSIDRVALVKRSLRRPSQRFASRDARGRALAWERAGRGAWFCGGRGGCSKIPSVRITPKVCLTLLFLRL
jgi:hypothetical protein